MQENGCIKCDRFPCNDVDHQYYVVPKTEINPQKVSIILISEAAPASSEDYYYAKGDPLFQQTTVQAFRDAGADVSSIRIQGHTFRGFRPGAPDRFAPLQLLTHWQTETFSGLLTAIPLIIVITTRIKTVFT